MSNPLRTPTDYELFLYSLQEQYPSIRRSTVTFVRRGASLARVSGVLHFANGPHHKHVPPDIKHNRIPAAGLSFTRPNLSLLIAEIEAILAEE